MWCLTQSETPNEENRSADLLGFTEHQYLYEFKNIQSIFFQTKNVMPNAECNTQRRQLVRNADLLGFTEHQYLYEFLYGNENVLVFQQER